MLLDLSGKVVVVTGAARGIGRVIAESFLAEGSIVVGLDLASPDLDSLASTFGDDARGMTAVCDVRDYPLVEETFADVVRRYGHLDVLINNAGINALGNVEDLDPELWRRCFDVNVGGTFNTCKAVVPIMKAQKSGRIINAASFAAIVPMVGSSAYAASKAAVVQLTRTLAGEVGPWNITANSYAPGMIPTSINGFAEMPADKQDELLDTLTLRRWGTATEVADLLRFLASDGASYITGTMIDVSGGKLATQIPRRAHDAAGNAKEQ